MRLQRAIDITRDASRRGHGQICARCSNTTVEACLRGIFRRFCSSARVLADVGSGPNATVLHYHKTLAACMTAICCSSTLAAMFDLTGPT